MQPFVYGLVDPADAGHVRYVGMAMRQTRPSEHLHNALNGTKHSHLFHWIRQLHAEGRAYLVVHLEDLPEGSARGLVGFIESCYIRSLRTIGHNLTNVFEGGWGGKNIRTQRVSDGVAQANRTRVWTPEMREKQRQSTLRRFLDPVERAKHGKKRSVESRAKQSAATRGTKKTSEHSQHIAEALHRYNQTPEGKAEFSDRIRRGWITRKAKQCPS